MNPHFSYCLSFSIALLAYGLGWSALYPKLGASVVAFLIATIILHFILGYRWRANSRSEYKPIQGFAVPLHIVITIFIYLFWTIDFAWEGGIPLMKIVLSQPYDYRQFGAPSLHVFTVTFASFYTVFLFHEYLSHRNKIILALYLVNLVAAILIYSRAMFVFNLIGSIFLLLMSMKSISKRFVVVSVFGFVILGYLFGILGTLRVSREAQSAYDNNLFLKIGEAKPSFSESFIPAEYFWSYMFITSPLANFQFNVNTARENGITLDRFAEMANNEILMDFISKRINAVTGSVRKSDNIVHPSFNVSTVYSRCYSYAGWFGVLFMAIILLALPLLFIKLIPSSSPFYMTAVAIMSTMFLFLAYDNTIRFTGLSFQLVYPVILSFLVSKLHLFRNNTKQISPV
ncbi:MAG TPA: hypothetical protein VD927_00045 [Chryseosolibacter sp.]|nr:hypothetical protein [Chryseosolibacter sp.]